MNQVMASLLVRNGQVVKGKQWNNWRVVGTLAQTCQLFAYRQIDSLAILCLDDAFDAVTVTNALKDVFLPVMAGGGNPKLDLFPFDAVVIKHPCEIRRAQERLGKQSIVAAVNSITTVEDALQAGAGQLLLQSKARDGMMHGYDLDFIRACRNYRVPKIASSGCADYEDMHMALSEGADHVCAGAMWLFTDRTPQEAKNYLSLKGWTVRQPQRSGSGPASLAPNTRNGTSATTRNAGRSGVPS